MNVWQKFKNLFSDSKEPFQPSLETIQPIRNNEKTKEPTAKKTKREARYRKQANYR